MVEVTGDEARASGSLAITSASGRQLEGERRAARVGLQDTPPGTAGIALAARADAGPEALRRLVLVPSVRGALPAVTRRDLSIFTAGLEPPDEAARALTGNAGSRSTGSRRWRRSTG